MKVKTRTAKKHTAYETPKWELGYLEAAEKDGRSFLADEQYGHVVQLFDELAYDSDPAKSQSQDVRKVYEFYELRDKGGVLGKINVRVYFVVIDERRLILVLAVYKKEDEDQMPRHIVIRVRNRLRIALETLSEDTQKG